MTREQRKQKNRTNLLIAAFFVLIATIMYFTVIAYVGEAFDTEKFKTVLAFVGAMALGAVVMRIVAWLDGEK